MAKYRCIECGYITKVRKRRGVPLKKWMTVLCGYIGTRMYLQKGGKRVKRNSSKDNR